MGSDLRTKNILDWSPTILDFVDTANATVVVRIPSMDVNKVFNASKAECPITSCKLLYKNCWTRVSWGGPTYLSAEQVMTVATETTASVGTGEFFIGYKPRHNGISARSYCLQCKNDAGDKVNHVFSAKKQQTKCQTGFNVAPKVVYDQDYIDEKTELKETVPNYNVTFAFNDEKEGEDAAQMVARSQSSVIGTVFTNKWATACPVTKCEAYALGCATRKALEHVTLSNTGLVQATHTDKDEGWSSTRCIICTVS